MLQENSSGIYFASAGDDIKIWNSTNLQIVKQFNFHKGNVKDLSWNSDNTFLCSASTSGDKILLTDCAPYVNEKAKVIAERALGEDQTCVRVSLSGRKLYSGGADGNVCVWDRESGKQRKIYKDTHSDPVTCIALNASETHVASGSNKGDVAIRNLSSDVKSRPDEVTSGLAIRGMTFSPWKHSLLGITMDDGSINLWDTLQGKAYHNFTQIHNAPAMDLTFSPFNDLVLASVGLDKHLMVFDVKRRKYLNKVKADQPLTSLAFLYDGYSLFAGSSLGRIYQYDLRNFSSAVNTVQAHSSTVQRIALQNKVRKSRSSKSSKNDRSRMSEHSRTSESAEDEVVGKKQKVILTGERGATVSQLDGRGDYFERGKIVTSSTNSTSSEGVDSKPVSNGFHHGQRSKPLENSTPTAVLKHDFDEMGVISPLRDGEVFGDATMTSMDGSILPHDPSLMRNTFSSSRDTFGSYCDDVLSPLSVLPKQGKGRISAGTQIHSKTSPHPLRQSYNVYPAEKTESVTNLRNSAPAPSFKAMTAKAREEASLKDSPEVNRTKESPSHRLSSLPPKSPTVSHTTPLPVTKSGDVSLQVASTSFSDVPGSSHAALAAAHVGSDMTGFQYQAEYLRNTVKEMVDELGDNLRRQINGVLNTMVKISLEQDYLNERRLNEKVCTLNEQLLRENQQLKEENDRLKRRCY